MEIQPDFRDLLALFTKHNVEYAIVGGYALAFHGAPRYTGDLDLLIEAEVTNADRVVAALEEFGFDGLGIETSDLKKPDQIIQLGYPPVRVDILTSVSGLSWKEVLAGRVKGKYGDVSVNFIGREQFLKNKRAAGRKKDLADIEALGED